MTEEFLRQLRKNLLVTSVTLVVMSHAPTAQAGSAIVEGRSPSAEPASASLGDGRKRARTPRVLTNVSNLWKIYLTEVDTVTSILDGVSTIGMVSSKSTRHA